MKAYCINLDSRPDKWEWISEESKKLDLELVRFSGFKRNKGHEGCRLSHLTLLAELKDQGEFMIIEDDMEICVDNPIELMNEAYSQLPEDWDMFYLGATLNQKLEQYSKNLYRLKAAWATQAIIYNNQNGVVDYIIENHNQPKFSVFLSNDVQNNFNCYITYPMIATQHAGMSDILRHYVDYKVITDRYKKYVG